MDIYTDGACKENARENGIATGTGGWAYVVLTQKPKQDMEILIESSGRKDGSTNQEMEIIAVTKAFESIKDIDVEEINLYSDSAYVMNCLKDRWFVKWRENGWLNSKGSPIVNQTEWERMLSFVEPKNVKFYHIRRNSSKYIKIVDGMAKKASRKETSQEQQEQ